MFRLTLSCSTLQKRKFLFCSLYRDVSHSTKFVSSAITISPVPKSAFFFILCFCRCPFPFSWEIVSISVKRSDTNRIWVCRE
ncbi:unnamed protein product [Citrullus colocynthis]|uniref:Uncharacterized protein n=1 Tax=Citrullus colocynthis TaxID=252529 RepID=A0ABP0Z162_9ROSI